MKPIILPILSLGLLLVSCKKYQESKIVVADNFDFTLVDTSGITSDGSSLIKLQITKKIESSPDLKVSLFTNKGNLISENLVFENNNANTFLRVAQDTGMYILKAVVKNNKDSLIFQKSLTFSINRALPDIINLDPNKTISSMSADTPTLIKTHLSRNTGLVTIGTPVNFRAYYVPPNNDTLFVGRIEGMFNNSSKADGTLNDIKFFSDSRNIDSSWIITIEANTFGNNGLISKKLNLRFQ